MPAQILPTAEAKNYAFSASIFVTAGMTSVVLRQGCGMSKMLHVHRLLVQLWASVRQKEGLVEFCNLRLWLKESTRGLLLMSRKERFHQQSKAKVSICGSVRQQPPWQHLGLQTGIKVAGSVSILPLLYHPPDPLARELSADRSSSFQSKAHFNFKTGGEA